MKIAIVVFAFGPHGDLPSNQLLKGITLRLIGNYPAVTNIYTQRALGLTLDDFERIDYTKRFKHSYYNNGEPKLFIIGQSDANRHPSTLRISEWIAEDLAKAGAGQLIVVAASPHSRRCLRDVRYALKSHGLGDMYVTLAKEPMRLFDNDDVWYSAKSDQPHTRSYKQWRRREDFLMILPMWLYALVAG